MIVFRFSSLFFFLFFSFLFLCLSLRVCQWMFGPSIRCFAHHLWYNSCVFGDFIQENTGSESVTGFLALSNVSGRLWGFQWHCGGFSIMSVCLPQFVWQINRDENLHGASAGHLLQRTQKLPCSSVLALIMLCLWAVHSDVTTIHHQFYSQCYGH